MSLDRLTLGRRRPMMWRKLRTLERTAFEGALALARKGNGQTMFVTLCEPRSFTNRRYIETLEVMADDSKGPLGLIHNLMRVATARPDARPIRSDLPDDLQAFVKASYGRDHHSASRNGETKPMDLSAWPIAIADFFATLSVETPLMLVINNAHRADVESVAMLETLARRVATSHILFVVTYRIDEAPNAQLKHLMQSLLNAKLARAVSVAASYADEGRLLFESAFGRALRPDKVGSSLDDDARHLIHGLLVVEMCRRTGRWSDALAVAERVVKASELHEAPYLFYSATIAIGHILADQGKWDESLKRLEQIQSDVEKSKENTLIAWLYWGIARVYWAKSARKTAFKMLRLARTVAERISDPTLRASIALCGVEWLADNKRLQPARDWLAWLEQIASQSDNAASDAPLAAANGIIAIAQKDPISATGFFRSALRLWSLIGNAYTVAHAHMRLSAALLPRDDAESRREGREELVEAHSAFTRLGATCDVNTVEELGAQYGVRPRARRAASGRSASPGGITPREREVLGLLVQGMTNRQIATELSITEKTAEGHVSNILAKLGVASRGQAAGYAVANGLLEGAEA